MSIPWEEISVDSQPADSPWTALPDRSRTAYGQFTDNPRTVRGKPLKSFRTAYRQHTDVPRTVH